MTIDERRGGRRGRIPAALLFLLMLVAGTATAGLQARIERAIQEEGITGAVWALHDGERSRVGAAGVAAAGRPMRPDARVHVGSIAKAVLATGVLRLASEGRLDLDAPVSALVPGIVFDNPWTDAPVRVRHLLDHTAGLDDMRLSQFFSLRATADMPLAEATDIGTPLRIRSRPGSRFSYSNTGYALLGRIIEEVTGQRYERYLDAALLHPLGMHDSTFAFTTQAGAAADARLAMGHFEAGYAHPAVPMHVRPAAQFTTTAEDMLRFSAFLMGDGSIDGAAFITPGLMRQRGRAQLTEAARAGLPVGYALGLARRDRHGTVGLCHGGDTVGFRAMLCAFPQHGRAFFIAFNADVEGADYVRIRAMIVVALGVTDAVVVGSTDVAADPGGWDGIYVPAPNRFAAFAYIDRIFGARHVAWRDGALRVRPLQGATRQLEPVGGRLFREPGRVLPSHALLIGDDGARVLVDDQQSYARIDTAHIVLLWTSLAAGLLGIVYVFVFGTWRVLRRHPWRDDPLRMPWWSVVALVLPLPLFLQQSFLQIGDFTAASATLAAATAALPIAMLGGLVQSSRATGGATRRGDAIAMLAVLQWCAVLAAWRLMPVLTWML